MKKATTLFLLLICGLFCKAQFVQQGICTKSGNTYTLNGISQSPYAGRLFCTTPINLNSNFEIGFSAYLGNPFNNGMAFVLLPGAQPTTTNPPVVISTDNIHNFGTGSINNDFVVEFDIRGSFCFSGQNTSYEPTTDVNHVSYWRNNSACTFGNYYSPYSALGIVNYYAYEPYRIKWTKSTNTLETYYGSSLIKSNIVDLVGLLGSNVYWGFSTGCYCVPGGPSLTNIMLNGIILPVTLTEFRGNLQNGKSLLSWKTSDETGMLTYNVERSTDGINYTTIGTVNALNGSGNHQYTFIDNNYSFAGKGIVYYRLRQVDLDARFTYSKIIVLSSGKGEDQLLLYPNPVSEEATLMLTRDKSERLQVRIIDATGREIKRMQWDMPAGSSTFSVEVNGLSKGLYYIELKGETTEIRKSFIKK